MFSTGSALQWTSSPAVAVLMMNPTNGLEDFFCASTAYPYSIYSPILVIPSGWYGATVPLNSNPAYTYQRQGNFNHRQALDWVATNRSVGTMNPSLGFPFTGNYTAIGVSPGSLFLTNGAWSGLLTIDAPGTNLILHADNGIGNPGTSNPFNVVSGTSAALLLPAQTSDNSPGVQPASISIPVALGFDLTFSLTSSVPTKIGVPVVVVIPAGATSAGFELTNFNDSLLDGTQLVMITASNYLFPLVQGVITNIAPVQPVSAAQLSVSQTVPALSAVGAAVTFTINVTNLGNIAASDILLFDSLPANTTFLSANSRQGTVETNSGKLIGLLGTIPPNGATTVSLTVVPQGAGILANAVNVSTTTADFDTSSENSTWSTTVTNSASGGQIAQLPLLVNDLVYNPPDGKLYASVSGISTNFGNSVVAIDPVSLEISNPIAVGTEPGALALAPDGRYLYVYLETNASFELVDLQTSTVTFEDSIYDLGYVLTEMFVLPGGSDSLLFSQYWPGGSPGGRGVQLIANWELQNDWFDFKIENNLIGSILNHMHRWLDNRRGYGHHYGGVDCDECRPCAIAGVRFEKRAGSRSIQQSILARRNDLRSSTGGREQSDRLPTEWRYGNFPDHPFHARTTTAYIVLLYDQRFSDCTWGLSGNQQRSDDPSGSDFRGFGGDD